MVQPGRPERARRAHHRHRRARRVAFPRIVPPARLRQGIEERAGRSVREIEGLTVTVSIGASFAVGTALDVKTLIDQADMALYEAKRAGRNQTKSHWQSLEQPVIEHD